MKIDMNQTFLYLALALFLASLVNSTEGGGGDGVGSVGRRCNATIAECVAANDGEEFLMESEISRRILAAHPISYKGFIKQMPYCDRDSYGSCIGPASKFYKERPCNYQDLCKRSE
ncbi:Uncharacterized protein Adt_00313 [Abeliophyllum distichum]|uniref:Uncharacterized protein n=1 Tax=Abeliophyllum distichum TaxID=126358 RepID=A0ABD1VPR3_9LAMI